jgi:hypothetical protein
VFPRLDLASEGSANYNTVACHDRSHLWRHFAQLALAASGERDRTHHQCPIILGIRSLGGHYPITVHERIPHLIGL